ncbi:MAG: T9SS type A sorting domain-containing protein, partial [Bacteroidetes bacterium]|nr:T9SS type A sorting domain-containing protein [Bacteroidota bacterium]
DGSITSYNITTIPNAGTQGTLYYCSNGTGPTCTGTITAIAGPTALTTAQAATLRFTPVAAFTGNITFNYTATDNSSQVSPAAAYIIPVRSTASAIHVIPYADNVVSQTVVNTAGATLIPTLAGHAPTGSISSYTIESIPSAGQGSLTYCSNGTEPCTGTVTAITAGTSLSAAQMATLKFIPNSSYSGTASFTYSATDNTAVKSNIASYTIPVVNHPPVANPVTANPMTNTFGQTTIPPLSGHDPGAIASYNITSIPGASAGVLYLCNPTCTAVTAGQSIAVADIAKLKFDPTAAFTGTGTFNYTATDNAGVTSAATTYNIPITASTFPGNLPPQANNVTSTAISNGAGQTAVSSLAGTDPDGTVASYTMRTLPSASQGVLYLCNPTCAAVTNGQVIVAADAASLKFTPTAGYVGNAVFDYTAKDNFGTTGNVATFTIPVTGNAPRTFNVQSAKMAVNSAQTALSSLSGAEAGGTIASYTINTLPPATSGTLFLCNPTCTAVTAGQVIAAADAASLKFTPGASFTGIYAAFNYTANDAAGMTANTATYTIPLMLGNTALPVQLISFGAGKQGAAVVLDWKTENEISFSNFVVERSADAVHYEALGSVPAYGTPGTHSYGYTDMNATQPILYYRLKMVDVDGHFSYSTVVAFRLDAGSLQQLLVAPNPAIDKVTVKITAAAAATATLHIVNIYGQQVYSSRYNLLKGENYIFIPRPASLPDGVYTIQASVNDEVLKQKLMLAR